MWLVASPGQGRYRENLLIKFSFFPICCYSLPRETTSFQSPLEGFVWVRPTQLTGNVDFSLLYLKFQGSFYEASTFWIFLVLYFAGVYLAQKIFRLQLCRYQLFLKGLFHLYEQSLEIVGQRNSKT